MEDFFGRGGQCLGLLGRWQADQEAVAQRVKTLGLQRELAAAFEVDPGEVRLYGGELAKRVVGVLLQLFQRARDLVLLLPRLAYLGGVILGPLCTGEAPLEILDEARDAHESNNNLVDVQVIVDLASLKGGDDVGDFFDDEGFKGVERQPEARHASAFLMLDGLRLAAFAVDAEDRLYESSVTPAPSRCSRVSFKRLSDQARRPVGV